MQPPQKDIFHILATTRMRKACKRPMRNFGSELEPACCLAELLENRKEPACLMSFEGPVGFAWTVTTASHVYPDRGVGVTISHTQRQTHRHR